MNRNSPEFILIKKDNDRQKIQDEKNKNEERQRNLAVAHRKAVELLNEERIDPKKFKGLYSNKMIEEDINYVEKRQQKFKTDDTPEKAESKKYATIFEAIIHDQIDMNGWLGEYATAKKTSWYDDLKNGVDEIIEFDQTEISPSAHLALAVDITFSKNVSEKIDEIMTHIESGDVGIIKYLLTDNYRGEMNNVPRAIIGVDMKNLQEIIKLWVDNKKKSLAQHRVKFIILSQIKIQLNSFAKYAHKIGQLVIANSFNRVLKIVENIWDEELKKCPAENRDFNFEEDRVFSAIKSYCGDLSK